MDRRAARDAGPILWPLPDFSVEAEYPVDFIGDAIQAAALEVGASFDDDGTLLCSGPVMVKATMIVLDRLGIAYTMVAQEVYEQALNEYLESIGSRHRWWDDRPADV